MNNKMIHLSKDCTATPTGSYAHKGLYPTLRFVTTLIILTLTATMAWAANSDATTLSTGNDDAPALQEDATEMNWATLKKALEEGNNVKLTNDVTRNADEVIEVTKEVTLDLNGYTIYGYETGSSNNYQYTSIFSVGAGGKLTITDGSSDKGGTITNVWGTPAISIGGTDESSYGEATFEAGTIASGGVYIGNYGRFTMTGGTINTGSREGVIVGKNATFTMTGGTITGNRVGVNINVASSTFTVSGNVNITGNTTKDVNLYYDRGNERINPIHIGGALASTARIGVWANQVFGRIDGKTFTEGLDDNGSRANFVSNIDDLVVVTTIGELTFASPITAHSAIFNGVTKYWATFYYNSEDFYYRLPEGSQAFYVKVDDNALYLLGDGNVIPNECAVIIMSDTDRIGLDKIEPWDVYVGKPNDNKLIGTNGPTDVSDVYVLSEVDGVLGFYKFTGEIPAHRAYYVE